MMKTFVDFRESHGPSVADEKEGESVVFCVATIDRCLRFNGCIVCGKRPGVRDQLVEFGEETNSVPSGLRPATLRRS